MLRDSAWVAVALKAFVARTVRLVFPAVVGVPEITPALDRLKPAGKPPAAIPQV